MREGKEEFELVQVPDLVLDLCREITGDRMEEAIFFAPSKQERQIAVDQIKEEASKACEEKFGDDFDPDHVSMAFEVIQEEVYRENILIRGKRADGRGPDDLREIICETGVLPRVHGSAIFTRGETQSLVLSTLGTSRDVQDFDGLTGGPTAKSFILHYNFPPFSVGEAGRFGFTGRREIGHGALPNGRCYFQFSLLRTSFHTPFESFPKLCLPMAPLQWQAFAEDLLH